MIVYRIEHKDSGYGPYGAENIGKKMCSAHLKETTHPCFAEDEIETHPNFNHRFVAGFDCEEKMREWFKGYGTGLKEHGYIIGIYEVDERLVIQGRSKKQVAFKREECIDSLVRQIKQSDINFL